MISYSDYKKKLTPEQRAKVDELARKLIAEEKTLREIRKARAYSQATLSELLGMNQGDLSKFERRSDAYLSTIRRYIEAMGGTLELVASFPDTGPVKITNLSQFGDDDEVEPEATPQDAPMQGLNITLKNCTPDELLTDLGLKPPKNPRSLRAK